MMGRSCEGAALYVGSNSPNNIVLARWGLSFGWMAQYEKPTVEQCARRERGREADVSIVGRLAALPSPHRRIL